MRIFVCVAAATLALGGVARAQPPAASAGERDRGYAEVVLQSAFGNVTSQNFGAEVGVTIVKHVQVFAEVGKTRDVATPALGANAQRIAAHLSTVDPNVSFSVKEPVTFGVLGVRFLLPVPGRVQPYVLGGAGIAKVTQSVKFFSGGTDVTANLAQPPYYTVLGTDLTGDFTKPVFVVGGGVAYPIWQRILLDFQFRFGRIMAEDDAITVGRAGLGVGVRF
jgi:opacity protein-like surface antigen